MLAGLAFKRRWQAQRKAAGKPYDKPNMIFGSECPGEQDQRDYWSSVLI